jgi:hypothetical protein
VTQYRVTVGTIVRTVGANTSAIDVGRLTNGQQVQVSVASMNDFYGAQPIWNSAGPVTVVPAGAPIWNGRPTTADAADGSGRITVSWAGLVSDNGSAFSGFKVSASAGSCDAVPPGATSTGCQLPAGTQVTLTVTAANGVGSADSDPVDVVPAAYPEKPTSVSIQQAQAGSRSDGLYFPVFLGASPAEAGAGATISYVYSLDGGSTVLPISPGGSIVTSAYGAPLNVRVGVVATYPGGVSLTSWSDPVDPATVGVAVNANADVTVSNGTLTWSSAPAGAGYTAVEYRCSILDPFTTMPAEGSCPNPGGSLTVRVTANGGKTYTMVYGT